MLECWDNFWADIVRPGGCLDIAQVARELYDYRVAMREAALVYDSLTGGRFSKPNTKAEYVIEAAEAIAKRDSDAAVRDFAAKVREAVRASYDAYTAARVESVLDALTPKEEE